jgi:hypothetical protein
MPSPAVGKTWGFIGKEENHVRRDDSPEYGDVWTFCAIDSDSKVLPTFKVGERDRETANAIVEDVSSHLRNRVQISSDALRAYVDDVELSFGADVTCGWRLPATSSGWTSPPAFAPAQMPSRAADMVKTVERAQAGHWPS